MLMNNYSSSRFEVGVDEAGRGSLAGPVTAAAVILPKNYKNESLDDSKKLSNTKRLELKKIIEDEALDYAIYFVSSNTIDKINILNSTIKAMHGAINKLKIEPEFILVDGNKFLPYKNISHECIIKGDSKYQNIAAASILAKTYRDIYMKKLHKKMPQYSWHENKGYGTSFHIDMINKFGKSEFHRQTFILKNRSQIKLEFNQ